MRVIGADHPVERPGVIRRQAHLLREDMRGGVEIGSGECILGSVPVVVFDAVEVLERGDRGQFRKAQIAMHLRVHAVGVRVVERRLCRCNSGKCVERRRAAPRRLLRIGKSRNGDTGEVIGTGAWHRIEQVKTGRL